MLLLFGRGESPIAGTGCGDSSYLGLLAGINGDIEIMVDMRLGRGRLATSEKKKDEDEIGVLGPAVRPGVLLSTDQPGENSAVGD